MALHPGEVEFGVDQGRVLPLRIGALAAEGAISAGKADGRKAASDDRVRRQAGEGERGVADGEIELAGFGAVETKAGIEYLDGADEARITKGDLLVEYADVAIGLAVQRNRHGREVNAVLLAVADTQEEGV